MAKQKRTKQQNSNKKRLFLIVAGGLILLSVLGLVVYRFAEQRRNLDELASAGKELRGVYEALLKLNGDNVTKSNFLQGCNEASVELGRGQITCWVKGTIELKNEVNLTIARANLEGALEGSGFSYNQGVNIYNGQYGSGVEVSLNVPYINMICDGDYAQNSVTSNWGYLLSCRKVAPDFLPGYTVEN